MLWYFIYEYKWVNHIDAVMTVRRKLLRYSYSAVIDLMISKNDRMRGAAYETIKEN